MGLKKSELDGQFVLTKKRELVPAVWPVRESRGWLLASHPSLHVVTIEAADGREIGWLIGHAIDLHASLLSGKTVFPVDMQGSNWAEELETAIYALGGRFAAVIIGGGIARLYLDPGASLSAVYSLHELIVASTPSLVPDHGGFDDDLIKTLRMPESGSYYPFGLTPYKHVRRLLPNHYLDLEGWKAVRHWPGRADLAVDYDTDRAVKEVISIIKNNVTAVSKQYRISMGLTAGRDTRLLLACSRSILDNILFITFSEKKQTMDAHVAGLLARRFNLDHAFLEVDIATPGEAEDWSYRVGHCVSGRISEIHPTLQRLDKSRALLAGMVPLGKRPLWRCDNNIEDLEIDARGLVERLHFPCDERILAMAEEWSSEFRGLRNSLMLDIAYVEQRMGCWGGPQMYGGDDRSACHLWPLNHRRIFELMMRLPSEYKKNRKFWPDACTLEWKELLDLPFNEYPGLLGLWQDAQRYSRGIARRAGKVFRYAGMGKK